jgi:hypothetical protein
MSQIKEEEDETRIKTLTKSILYNSTSQACINLVHTRHLVLKLFLAVCICATLVASSFFVITNILMYFEFEVTTVSRQVFDDDHEKGMTTLFPKVTFCNQNQFTTEKALEFLKQVDKSSNNNISVFDRTKMKNLTQRQKTQLYTSLNTMATSTMLQNKLNFSHSLEDIVLSCFFNNQVCNMNDFLSFLDPIYGLCFLFKPSKPVYGAGPLNGIIIDVYMNFHENLTEFNAFTGGLGGLIRIENNSHNNIDHDVDGLFFETGKWHSIAVRRRFKTNLPRPYSNCDISSENEKTFSTHYEIYKMIRASSYDYSQAFCLKQCTQLKAISLCGCSNPFYVSLYALACQNESEIECSQEIFFNRAHFQGECLLKCPLECSSTSFETTQTSVSLLGDSYLGYINENPHLLSDFVRRPISLHAAKESVVKLSIFYESLSYEMSKEYSKMNVVDLLANIGGTMSLFLGISVLSFCELVELLIEIVYVWREKKVAYLEEN